MAGIPGKGGVKGKSGPPGNMNAFKHGLGGAIEEIFSEAAGTSENLAQDAPGTTFSGKGDG